MINKLNSYIGFSIKSNKVIFGLDDLIYKDKQNLLVIISSSLSDNSKNKLINLSKLRNYTVISIDEEVFNTAVNKYNCKLIAILNKDLAKAILQLNEFYIKIM